MLLASIHRLCPASWAAIAVFGVAGVGAGRVRAESLDCGLAADHAIQVDGLLGDWRGVPPLRVDQEGALTQGGSRWDGPHDLSFELRCNHDAHSLYLALRVVDDTFRRSRRGSGGDHVAFEVGRDVLRIWPADLRGIRQKKQGPPALARAVTAMEARQQDGYSLEVAMPLARVPGYRAGRAAIALRVSVFDADDRRGAVASTMSTPPLQVTFAEQCAQLDAFLADVGEQGQPLRVDVQADVCGDRRRERVVLAGRTIGVIGPGVPSGAGYFYLRLPVRRREDVQWLRLYDLNGDGRVEIVVRYMERASNGRRALVVVYRFDSHERPQRAFVHEVEKIRGNDSITNRVRFERRHRRGKRDVVDIVVDMPRARGFSEQTFAEQPAPDARSILLPWSGERRRVFRFEGDGVSATPTP